MFASEIMPASARTAGFSLAFSLATAMFGGFTPAVCTWLIHETGNRAMPGAWLGFGNPFLARQLHVHKFTPARIERLAARCGLRHVNSALDLLITPQFMTVLEKAPRGE